MSNLTFQEKLIEGLQNGDIDLADSGVTVDTITIAQYEVVRQRGLELLQSTDFTSIAGTITPESFAEGTPQCDIDEAIATFEAYARQDYTPQINATNQALNLLGGFSPDTPLLEALAQTEPFPYQPYLGPGSVTNPVVPTEPVEPTEPTTPVAPTAPNVTAGTVGDDRLKGSSDADTIRGKAGDDTLIGRGGDDKLIGGGGADTVKGGRGDDTVKGGGGADDLKGNGGADNIKGGGGGDTVKGGGGNDIINGGGGADLLIGGGGGDMFVFTGRSGADWINAFQFGLDKLDIRQTSDFASLDIEQVQGGALISFEGGEVLLAGRLANAISEDDFMF